MCKTIYNTTQHLECYIKMINSLIILTLICNILNDTPIKIRIHFKCSTLSVIFVLFKLGIDIEAKISKTIHRQSVRNIL